MTEVPQPPAHDDTGLDLARSMAQSVGAQSRRRRRRDKPRQSTVPQSSGAHPDERDPKLLSEAVERLIEAKGWATDINVHTLLARWSSLVGGVNAAHSHPESYADTVLTVRAESTVWATSLRSIAPPLVPSSMSSWGGKVTVVKVLFRSRRSLLEEGSTLGSGRAGASGHLRLSRP